jgi:translocation and assembly module TamA
MLPRPTITVALLAPIPLPRGQWALVLLALLLACMLPAAAQAAEARYRADIVGVSDKSLLETLTAVSQLIAEAERPPPTVAAIRRRADADMPRLEEALASLGYYGATVRYDLDATKTPVRVTIHVEPGEPYKIADYHITGDNPALTDGRIKITPRTLGLQKGVPAESKRVVDAEVKLLGLLAAQAYPLARVADRKVIVDHATRSMTVDWRIDTGPHARFGEVKIQGLTSVDERFVRARLPIKTGEPYNGDKVEQGRSALVDTRLFSAVRIDHADKLDSAGQLPITVTLIEGKRRSLGGGVSYSTSEGFTGQAFWEHRNLFGGGERLTLTLLAGETVQGGKADFRKPGLTNTKLAYIGNLQALRQNFEAYDATTIGGAGGVEYQLTDHLTATGSLSLEHLDIDEGVQENKYLLLGAPMGLTYDTTTDLLDPLRGTRLNFNLAPYVSVAETGANFVVSTLSDALYVPLQRKHRIVLAGWGRIGTILGADNTFDVPATKRLYGGGPNSVRAYGYQELGPIGADGDPTGGRSQVEGGLELRWRMFGDFGGAAFIEGGNVYDDPVPDFKENLLFGGGVGVRYFTAFGPLRADIAFPINPRDSDKPFQFYIGIGQAF